MSRPLLIVTIAAASLAAPLAGQQARFQSGVDAVVVPVSVTDRNAPVPNLTAADFQLFDNGVRQEIAFTTVDRLPVDVTLMLDTSGSINGPALERLKADVQAMGDFLQPNDRVRLVAFARTLTDVFDLQPGGARLPVDRIRAGGVTALYDALATALIAFPYTDRPQLIVVLTDGLDTSSFLEAERVVSLAQYATALLYVGIVSSSEALTGPARSVEAVDPFAAEQSQMLLAASGGNAMRSISRYTGPYRGSPDVTSLSAAAAATGGVLYENPAGTAIPELFRHVIDDFRASYLLTYTLRNVPRGGWHTITVKTTNDRYTVRARKGYQVEK
jgi:VWFA-related protein